MNIFVVGAGTMGHGIAQVAAASGHEVVLMDIDGDQLMEAKKAISRSSGKLFGKGLISEDQLDSISNIKTTTNCELSKNSDLVIEAVVEKRNIKKEIFSDLDQVVPRNVIFASNTSSISITELASSTNREELVIGMHFMNPVPLMKLVEVVPGLKTVRKTVEKVFDLCRSMGKKPIEAKDSPGFISNRVLCPMINEAIFALQEEVGTPSDIDSVMKLGMNHPMGPLELCDLIGLDVVLNVMKVLHQDFGDDKYRPAYLLRKMVEANLLGRKTGEGFYKY
jgi:3-hydroxybutyryl-CoA dehydrogenase